MGRSKHRQHELDTVTEQQRDAVTLLKALRAQTRRDPRGGLSDLAPAHTAVAADQRLAVGIARRGLIDHGPDALRALAEGRYDAVAKARFHAHRRDGIARP